MVSFNWRDHVPKILAGIAAAAVGIAVTTMGRIPSGEDATDVWAMLFFGFVAGVVLFVYGFREYRRRSLVTNTPTSKVRSMALGVIELFGTARPTRDGTFRAPFSGQECVLYKYEVEEYRQRGKHSHWETIDQGTSDAPFYLDDGTGQVMVDPQGADLRLPQDEQYHADHFEELPQSAQDWIRNTPGVSTQEDEWFEEDRRYTEYIVTPGQDVYVFGKAFPRGEHRGSSINPENAYVNADQDTPMFVISDRSESELLSSMTWHVYVGIIGGFVLAVGTFTGLVMFLGLL